MKKDKLSIVIPAKNEEKRISRTLSLYGSYFDARRADLDTEIIVVVNNSTDRTGSIVDEYARKYPFIRKIETYYAAGKGGSVSLGFKEADGDYIGFVDADGAIPASELYKLYEFLEETPWLDGVTGVREKSATRMSLKRRIISKAFNAYVRSLFKIPYSDTQCGAKIFRKIPAKSIAKKLSNTGWAFDVNLLLVAKYLNFRVLEFPVLWSEKEGSKFSLAEALIQVPLELYSLKLLEISYYLNNLISGFLSKEPASAEVNEGVKNILIFAWRDIKHPENGGSELYVHEIAQRLAKKHNVTLFTSQSGNLSSQDEIDGVKIIRRGNILTVYFWAFLHYILYLDQETDFVVDVQNGIPFFTPWYSRKPKLMILHHVHKNQWFKQFNPVIAIVGFFIEFFLMPVSYRKVPVVTVSPSSLQELKKLGFNDKRIYLAYNSIPVKIGGRYGESITPLIVYVGRLKAYKRIDMALRAIPQLAKVFPKIKMIIGGAGDDTERLKVLTRKLKIEKYIEFLGFISEKKKWEIMQKGWVFVMPSMKEGWGITIMESASSGTPAVGFNVAGVRDSIKNGTTGLLAEDETDFRDKVQILLGNYKLRDAMKQNCYKWARMFSWDTTAGTFETIINLYSGNKGLLSDKTYPWDLDLRTETLTSLASMK